MEANFIEVPVFDDILLSPLNMLYNPDIDMFEFRGSIMKKEVA